MITDYGPKTPPQLFGPLKYRVEIDQRSRITLSHSTVENLMQHIDNVDKGYLKQINDVTVITPHGHEIKLIIGTKRIVLGAIADLLLEFTEGY